MLADWQIVRAVEKGDITIEPFFKSHVNPNSYDVTLGNSFFYNNTGEIIDPRKPRIIGEHINSEEIVLGAQDCILGTTIETIGLSNGYVAVLNGKSSIGRHNISIHQTAGYIDAGFKGQITLEIFNANGRSDYILRNGDLIGQLVFYKVEKSEIPYNERMSSKYMNEVGATPSAYYKNYMR